MKVTLTTLRSFVVEGNRYVRGVTYEVDDAAGAALVKGGRFAAVAEPATPDAPKAAPKADDKKEAPKDEPKPEEAKKEEPKAEEKKAEEPAKPEETPVKV